MLSLLIPQKPIPYKGDDMVTGIAEIDYDDSEVAEDDTASKINSRFPGTKRAVQCLCPKCNKRHSAKLFWTGSGTPRLYCQRCRDLIATICDGLIYEIRPAVSMASGRRRSE